MNAAGDRGRNALMLNELRLPTIGRLWTELAQRSDTESWPARRLRSCGVASAVRNSTGT